MKYITHKRFKEIGIDGEFNLPYGTELEEADGMLFHNGRMVCVTTSENAHQYFAVNDDDKGLERGKLTQEIQTILSKRDDAYQARWDKIWGNLGFHKYKRSDYDDYWLWNHDFFNAPIKDLQNIIETVRGI